MRGFLRAKFRRKRTVEEYEKFSFENVWKITRLIGGV